MLATLVIAAATIMLASMLWFWPHKVVSLLERIDRRVVYRFFTNEPVVCLTFDDGPSAALTMQIVELLGQYEARATFFMLGERMNAHPEIVDIVTSCGHEIGIHMMRDEPSILLDSKTFNSQMSEFQAASRDISLRWYRPGSGWYTRKIVDDVEALGYRCCLGSIYANDPVLRSPGIISRHIIRNVRSGDIVVLHEGCESRSYVLQVLQDILPSLSSRGFRFCTLSDAAEGWNSRPF